MDMREVTMTPRMMTEAIMKVIEGTNVIEVWTVTNSPLLTGNGEETTLTSVVDLERSVASWFQ